MPPSPLKISVLAGFLSISACVFLSELIGLGPQRPRVEVVDMVVTGISTSQVDIEVGLDIANPNSYELALARVHYQLESMGLRIAHGAFDNRIAVQGNDHTVVRLPIRVDMTAAKEFVGKFIGHTERISAVLSGSAVFDTRFGGIEMPFHEERVLLDK